MLLISPTYDMEVLPSKQPGPLVGPAGFVGRGASWPLNPAWAHVRHFLRGAGIRRMGWKQASQLFWRSALDSILGNPHLPNRDDYRAGLPMGSLTQSVPLQLSELQFLASLKRGIPETRTLTVGEIGREPPFHACGKYTSRHGPAASVFLFSTINASCTDQSGWLHLPISLFAFIRAGLAPR